GTRPRKISWPTCSAHSTGEQPAGAFTTAANGAVRMDDRGARLICATRDSLNNSTPRKCARWVCSRRYSLGRKQGDRTNIGLSDEQNSTTKLSTRGSPPGKVARTLV